MNKPQPSGILYILTQSSDTKVIVFWAIPDIITEMGTYGKITKYDDTVYFYLNVYPWYNYQETLSYLKSLGENK